MHKFSNLYSTLNLLVYSLLNLCLFPISNPLVIFPFHIFLSSMTNLSLFHVKSTHIFSMTNLCLFSVSNPGNAIKKDFVRHERNSDARAGFQSSLLPLSKFILLTLTLASSLSLNPNAWANSQPFLSTYTNFPSYKIGVS